MPLYIHLSPAAQKRARDWYREHCLDYEWWDSDYDHWKEKLGELGFTKVAIKFSGFYSQGDGASFTASVIREFNLPEAIAIRIAEEPEPPNALVYLTEVYGSFPDQAPAYPVIWAANNRS